MADDAGYTFDEQTVRRIAASVRAFEKASADKPSPFYLDQFDRKNSPIVGVCTSEVTRGSLAAPTSFTFEAYLPSGDAYDAAWTSAGEELEALELGLLPEAQSPLAVGTQVRVVLIANRLVLDNADCPED